MTKVVLLDIDGVLVHHGGYRAALHATLNHFVSLMGLSHFDFTEEELADLEKRGIFSEWDMVPILLGALWNDILSRPPKLDLPSDLSSAAVEIGRNINGYRPGKLFVPEFDLIPGRYPAESAFRSGCFPSIPVNLQSSLLHDSRNVGYSQTTRLFQHYSLGSRVFSDTYNLPAELETESLLLTHDRSYLNDSIRAKLCQPDIYLAALTARPSAAPREIKDANPSYPPEAEIALKLVGLPDIPLIGFGKLQYLAFQRGLDASALIKPSPVHALAAIAAALTGNEWIALQSACDWHQTGKLNGVFANLPQSFELLVVEDTLGGIRSVQSAGEILRDSGFNVVVRTFGLTSGSTTKAAAFEQFEIPHFANWETMIKEMNL